jgi:cytochrome c2
MMLKISAIVAVLGLALLVLSLLPGAGSSAETAAAARGKVLFRDKGCASCHVHPRVGDQSQACCLGEGPDLTAYTGDPAFLRRWLHDPQAVRPRTFMPNVGLSAAEIEDLIAFLNEPR